MIEVSKYEKIEMNIESVTKEIIERGGQLSVPNITFKISSERNNKTNVYEFDTLHLLIYSLTTTIKNKISRNESNVDELTYLINRAFLIKENEKDV